MLAPKQMRAKRLKLTIELVPQTLWFANLRKAMPKDKWDELRRGVYSKAGYECEVCGPKNSRLNCHEIWTYDDKKHIQKLRGFVCLCDMCNRAKHIGFAGILASRGELDFDAVVRHFVKVNKVRKKDFAAHYAHAVEQWRERSKHKWKTDLGRYAPLIKVGKSNQLMLKLV